MGKFCWLKGARTKRSNDAGEEKKEIEGQQIEEKTRKRRERGSQKTKEQKKVVETGKLASLITLRHTKPYA